MTRETAPYLVAHVGPGGVDERGARYVLGPALGPSYSQLRAEVERLQGQVDNESRLRVQAQDRLGRAMRVLASLGRLSPRLAALIERGRAEVYGELP